MPAKLLAHCAIGNHSATRASLVLNGFSFLARRCHSTPAGAISSSYLVYRRPGAALTRPAALHRRHQSSRATTNNGRLGSQAGCILLGGHVREALANGQPVVALESTVLTHGLPEPENLRLALQLERDILDGCWWRAGRDQESGGVQIHATTPQVVGTPNLSRLGFDKSGQFDSPVTAARRRGLSSERDSMAGQVVPATVGIIRGQLIVGLSEEQIEFLANKAASRPIKASRRDLALAQAAGLSAGTTVSATMAIASSVRWGSSWRANGISVFATGGMGGVHVGGENSLDISADLYEMARSPMCVVSSGFKSFLDTRRSLEFLETMGCTVASLRQTSRAYEGQSGRELASVDEKKAHLFPGFFTSANQQQVRSPWQCDHVQEAARILFHCLGPHPQRGLSRAGPTHMDEHSARMLAENQSCGRRQPSAPDQAATAAAGATASGELFLREPRAMLLACPIPSEFSLTDHKQAQLIEQITKRIEAQPGLSGHEKTPLILAELARSTGGQTLEANLALLRNNARIGAHLAYEYSKLRESVGAISAPIWTGDDGEQVGRNDGGASGGGGETTEAKKMENEAGAKWEPRGTNSAASRRPRRPIVIGCTMIDMHVRTKMDDQFKVSGAILAT